MASSTNMLITDEEDCPDLAYSSKWGLTSIETKNHFQINQLIYFI